MIYIHIMRYVSNIYAHEKIRILFLFAYIKSETFDRQVSTHPKYAAQQHDMINLCQQSFFTYMHISNELYL